MTIHSSWHFLKVRFLGDCLFGTRREIPGLLVLRDFSENIASMAQGTRMN
jgi:hypothetical protein